MRWFRDTDPNEARVMNWVREIGNSDSSEKVVFKHNLLHCRIEYYTLRLQNRVEIAIKYIDKPSSVLMAKYEQAFSQKSWNSGGVNRGVSLTFSPDDKKAMAPSLTQFLKLFLDHYQLWGTEICAELHSLCDIVDLEALWSSLVSKVSRGEVAEAINDAVKYQADLLNYETIWRLVQHLLQLMSDSNQNAKINIFNVYKLCEGISERNPHYAESRLAMQKILMGTPVTEENKMFLLENKFKAALQAKEYVEADRFFNELCGRPFSLIPIIPNVQGNVETLCQLATQIRLMQEEINELKTTIANIPEHERPRPI